MRLNVLDIGASGLPQIVLSGERTPACSASRPKHLRKTLVMSLVSRRMSFDLSCKDFNARRP